MSGISVLESSVIGLWLEGYFFGLYSAIFILYIQYQASAKGSHKARNILFYALCALYILSGAALILGTIISFTPDTYLNFGQEGLVGFCDFIAQSILIYRCWFVWGCNIRIMIIPSILAFTFLATWLVAFASAYASKGSFLYVGWGAVLILTSLVISLIVNALVTGLIVFRIFNAYREAKPTPDNQDFHVTVRNKLQSVMFILIESGMTLFSIQVVRVAFTLYRSKLILKAFYITVGIEKMLYGITPTIILVRVAMGLSFHDEESMIETTGSLHFASGNLGSTPEVGAIDIEHHESGDDSDDIGVRIGNDSDIQTADR